MPDLYRAGFRLGRRGGDRCPEHPAQTCPAAAQLTTEQGTSSLRHHLPSALPPRVPPFSKTTCSDTPSCRRRDTLSSPDRAAEAKRSPAPRRRARMVIPQDGMPADYADATGVGQTSRSCRPCGHAACRPSCPCLPGSTQHMSVSALKKVKREGGAQRRPAQSERKNRAFSAKRQAVWFGMRSIPN